MLKNINQLYEYVVNFFFVIVVAWNEIEYKCVLKIEHDQSRGSAIKWQYFLECCIFLFFFCKCLIGNGSLPLAFAYWRCRCCYCCHPSNKYWLKMRQVWLWYWNNSDMANMARKYRNFNSVAVDFARPWIGGAREWGEEVTYKICMDNRLIRSFLLHASNYY